MKIKNNMIIVTLKNTFITASIVAGICSMGMAVSAATPVMSGVGTVADIAARTASKAIIQKQPIDIKANISPTECKNSYNNILIVKPLAESNKYCSSMVDNSTAIVVSATTGSVNGVLSGPGQAGSFSITCSGKPPFIISCSWTKDTPYLQFR